MRLFTIFAIWMIAGLGATTALSATLEQVLVPTTDSAQAEAYTPPTLTSMGFVADSARRS
ncbi:hypothetical protein [Reyranella sp.]|jgi:hypothetical protein|uniref:hypothetical protein n=1 Tax=Reyranella sp. TaxID=1929291 RepID=UPI002F948300